MVKGIEVYLMKISVLTEKKRDRGSDVQGRKAKWIQVCIVCFHLPKKNKYINTYACIFQNREINNKMLKVNHYFNGREARG